jgi:hypothetical protein
MEHFQKIKKRKGCDIGMMNDLHPEHLAADEYPRKGKSGFDKKLKLEDIMDIAYRMNNPKPNIIIKAGNNAKWYLKYSPKEEIDERIEKTKFRDLRRCTMYIIDWE